MMQVQGFVERYLDDNETQRELAGAAIAQFLFMREGLKGRVENSTLDATAATLTAAVLVGAWITPPDGQLF